MLTEINRLFLFIKWHECLGLIKLLIYEIMNQIN